MNSGVFFGRDGPSVRAFEQFEFYFFFFFSFFFFFFIFFVFFFFFFVSPLFSVQTVTRRDARTRFVVPLTQFAVFRGMFGMLFFTPRDVQSASLTRNWCSRIIYSGQIVTVVAHGWPSLLSERRPGVIPLYSTSLPPYVPWFLSRRT